MGLGTRIGSVEHAWFFLYKTPKKIKNFARVWLGFFCLEEEGRGGGLYGRQRQFGVWAVWGGTNRRRGLSKF